MTSSQANPGAAALMQGRRGAAMRARYFTELAGPAAAALLAAEAQSLRYWRCNALGYGDRVADGFYEAHGAFPEICPPTEFPHLAALMKVLPKPDQQREVVLVDRRHDRHLTAMREEAQAAVARAGAVGSLERYQALAQVVAGHMGGALESQPAAAEQWCGMINSVKVQRASVVVPIGLLHIGSARHRALLYKVLAGDLGMPCRIVKGGRTAGKDAEAAQAVVVCSNVEYFIDLLARPGEVVPVPPEDRLAGVAEERGSEAAAACSTDARVHATPAHARAWSAGHSTGGASSQPLPVRPRASRGTRFGIPGHVSLPVPSLERSSTQETQQQAQQGQQRLRSDGSGGGGIAGKRFTQPSPPVQLSEEDLALLAALDVSGPSKAPAAAARQAQQAQQQQQPQATAAAERRPASAAPSGVGSTSEQAPRAALAAPSVVKPTRHSTAPHSLPGAVLGPLDCLPPALSLEHALHLAAAAAMGSGSSLELAQTSGSSGCLSASRGLSTDASKSISRSISRDASSAGGSAGDASRASGGRGDSHGLPEDQEFETQQAQQAQHPRPLSAPSGSEGGARHSGGSSAPELSPTAGQQVSAVESGHTQTAPSSLATPRFSTKGGVPPTSPRAFDALPSPFGGVSQSPFAGAPLPPRGPASQPPFRGASQSPFAVLAGASEAEGAGRESSGHSNKAAQDGKLGRELGEDEGVELNLGSFSFEGFRSQALVQQKQSTAEAEDAMIEAAVDSEMGECTAAPPAGGSIGSGSGGSTAAAAAGPQAQASSLQRLAAEVAGLPPVQGVEVPLRLLRSLGEFEGVSTIQDLSVLVGDAAMAAPLRLSPHGQQAQQQAQQLQSAAFAPQQQQQQQSAGAWLQQQSQQQQHSAATWLQQQQAQQAQQAQQWPFQMEAPGQGSPLVPGLLGGPDSGQQPRSVRQSGPAALEALASLQAQQRGRRPTAQQGQQQASQQLVRQPSQPLVHQPSSLSVQRLPSGASSVLSGSKVSFELGPAHLEVDEATGEAFLVQPVVRAGSSRSSMLGSQPSQGSSEAQPSSTVEMMELVEALRASGVLETGLLPLRGTPPFGSSSSSTALLAQSMHTSTFDSSTPTSPGLAIQQRALSEPLPPAAYHSSSGVELATRQAPAQPASPDNAQLAAQLAAGGPLHPPATPVAAVGASRADQLLYSLSGVPVTAHMHRLSLDSPTLAPSMLPAPPRLSVPLEWEQLQVMRQRSASAGSVSLDPGASPLMRRRNSSGDPFPLPVPFGGAIPEGSPFNPLLVRQQQQQPNGGGTYAGSSPFANNRHAVAAGGIISLLAMHMQVAAMGGAAAGAGAVPSDDSSFTGSLADATESLHSTTSEGTVHPGTFMAGLVLEGLEEWEIEPDEIVLGPRIGIGSFGEVYRGIWRQTDVAVKRLLDQEVSQQMLEEFRQEICIMKRLHHPHIVQFLGAVTQPPHLCIVTQFVPRGSLFKLLHRTPAFNPDERRRLQMALDIARGMNFLHTCKPPIIHRDLKSPNLLVDKDLTVKVCDFGLSRARASTMLSTKSQAGTPEWTAPEVLRSQPYNEKCDIFSYGVILWELMTDEEPWHDKSAMQVVGAVGWSNLRLDIPDDIHAGMRALIEECFGEPQDRPHFSDIIPRLRKMIKEFTPPPAQER